MDLSFFEAFILFLIGTLFVFCNKKTSEYIIEKQKPYLSKMFGTLVDFESLKVKKFYRFWSYGFGAIAYLAVIAILFGPFNL